MPVIIAGNANAKWGLTPETGIIVQRGTWRTHIEENPSKNANGEFAMTSWFNPTQSISIFGIYLGSGLANAIVGTTIALANVFSNNGVKSGGIYLTEIEQAADCVGFVSSSLTCVRRPLI